MTSAGTQPQTESSATFNATRILLPLSGAQKDERALPAATALAHRLDLPLVLMSAVSDDVLIERLEAYLARIDDRIDGVATDIAVVQGPNPLKTIAAQCDPDTLPVMATSGRLLIHDTYLGSAGAWVVRQSNQPVVLVGPDCRTEGVFDVDRVIVPVDGSSFGDRAVELGVSWGKRLGLPVWLVSVLPEVEPAKVAQAVGADVTAAESNHLRSLARDASRHEPAVQIEWEVLHGRDAADRILEFAGAAALICMASHGRTGLASIAMGSVARKVARRAVQPVVVWCCPEVGSDE